MVGSVWKRRGRLLARPEEGLRILEAATTHPLDDWLEPVPGRLASLRVAADALVWQAPKTHLQGLAGKLFTEGAETYRQKVTAPPAIRKPAWIARSPIPAS